MLKHQVRSWSYIKFIVIEMCYSGSHFDLDGQPKFIKWSLRVQYSLPDHQCNSSNTKSWKSSELMRLSMWMKARAADENANSMKRIWSFIHTPSYYSWTWKAKDETRWHCFQLQANHTPTLKVVFNNLKGMWFMGLWSPNLTKIINKEEVPHKHPSHASFWDLSVPQLSI